MESVSAFAITWSFEKVNCHKHKLSFDKLSDLTVGGFFAGFLFLFTPEPRRLTNYSSNQIVTTASAERAKTDLNRRNRFSV